MALTFWDITKNIRESLSLHGNSFLSAYTNVVFILFKGVYLKEFLRLIRDLDWKKKVIATDDGMYIRVYTRTAVDRVCYFHSFPIADHSRESLFLARTKINIFIIFIKGLGPTPPVRVWTVRTDTVRGQGGERRGG